MCGLILFLGHTSKWMLENTAARDMINRINGTAVSNSSPALNVSQKKNWDDTLRILTWTPDLWKVWTEDHTVFSSCNLPKNQTCKFVSRDQYNWSEAIMFQAYRIRMKDVPKYRLAHQKWIFYENEAPPQAWIYNRSIDPIRSSFNITATFTSDSDVPMMWTQRSCTFENARYKEQKLKNINYAKGKGNRVAWFASHCNTQSKRELYVKQLSRYIPVDIWGKCGNLTCSHKYHLEDCDEKILNPDYKFYLSFENSICESYVTEKLWRLALHANITTIPIVMGGINYSKILPKQTYIDIKDFKSPKDLANYLYEIDRNDNVFNEYILRKKALKCRFPNGKKNLEDEYPCRVCKFLHEHRNDVMHAPDVIEFWSEKRRCTPPEMFYNLNFSSWS